MAQFAIGYFYEAFVYSGDPLNILGSSCKHCIILHVHSIIKIIITSQRFHLYKS